MQVGGEARLHNSETKMRLTSQFYSQLPTYTLPGTLHVKTQHILPSNITDVVGSVIWCAGTCS